MPIETDQALRELLERVRSIAVVGVKAGPADDAFRVPRYMQEHGYRILPVSPKLDRVLGEPCVPSLASLEDTPDLVNVFRASAHIPQHVEEVLAMPARPVGVWLQLGIRNPAATRRLEQAGIAVVEDRCLLVEHGRLLGTRE
jgi:predicted CoA-binding protein